MRMEKERLGRIAHQHRADPSHPAHAEPQKVPAADLVPIQETVLETALGKLSKETVWRVKGFVRTERGLHILNWAFGRHELSAIKDVAAMNICKE